jgi:intein/homing endonuclease
MALLENIKQEEIEFYEFLCDPVAMAETLWHDFDNFQLYNQKEFGGVRTGQLSMLSYEYLIDDKDKKLTKKENFKRLEGAGNIYSFGARRFGKSVIVLIVDMLESLIHLDNWHCLYSSYDALHVLQVLERVIPAAENHPFFQLFDVKVKRSPNYVITAANGFEVQSVNMNITSKTAGSNFFGHHTPKLWTDEFCLDGKTKIKIKTPDGVIKTEVLGNLVKRDLWKNCTVLSYNLTEKTPEFKKVTNTFKKLIKKGFKYKLTLNNSKQPLICSENERIYTQTGYKCVQDITLKDKLFNVQQSTLTDIQKQIALGCLLGDSCLIRDGICFVHGLKQEVYLDYKVKCFNNLFQFYSGHKKKVEIKSYPKSICGSDTVKTVSHGCKDLLEFNNLKSGFNGFCYTSLNEQVVKKYFTPIALAFWYMDDGSLRSYNTKSGRLTRIVGLHTEAFDYNTQQMLVDLFELCYNIKVTITGKNKYSLRMNPENSEKFLKLIAKYIHPQMDYKLYGKDKPTKKIKFKDLTESEYNLQPVDILKIEKVEARYWTMYDLEVKDNNNFFANDVLVHNSKCTTDVENKLIDAVSELGCINRFAGMTDFTRHSPAGRIFDDLSLRKWVCNFPQYISPMWDEEERYKQERRYGGTKTASYRTFVLGEVCEDGISVFDMERVRMNYNENKRIKVFEINKDSFKNFKSILVLERPSNAKICIVGADIGETAPTEIAITFKINDKYHYTYNVTLYNLTDKQQYRIFKYIFMLLDVDAMGLDAGDGSIDENEFVLYKIDNKLHYSRAKNLPKVFEKRKTVDVPAYNKGKLEWKPGTLFQHSYEGKMLEFQSKPGSGKIKVTPNHSMMIYEEGGLIKKQANNVKIGDWLVCPKNDKLFQSFCDDYIFIEYETRRVNQYSPIVKKQIKLDENLAYLLGWAAAEGSFKDVNVGYQLSLGNEPNEASHIAEVFEKVFNEKAKVIKREKDLTHSHYIGKSLAQNKEPYCYKVYFSGGKGIAKLFSNMLGRGCENKRVPIEILNSPKNVQKAFLDGLLEGDGIGDKRLKVKSEELVYGVSLLVKNLGYYPTISKINPPADDDYKQVCWSVEWNNTNTALLGRWLGVPSKFTPVKYRNNRKWYDLNGLKKKRISKKSLAKIQSLLDNDFVFRQITNISEYDYNGQVYDLCVEDNNTFCAGSDNVIVHNTGRAIFRRLEEDLGRERLFYYDGSKKIVVGYRKDEEGRIIMVNGKPEVEEEFMSEWSVKHLKTLLYDEKMMIPQDFKFDTQINSVISLTLANRTAYECVHPDNHLFDAFRVWSLTQWSISFNENNLIKRKPFSKTGV